MLGAAPTAAPTAARGPRLFFALLAGVLAGTLAQLQQQALSAPWLYALCALPTGVALCWAVAHRKALPSGPLAQVLALLLSALLVFALCGWRAGLFLGTALERALEGRDLVVSGVVSAMPQRNESGLRFRFEIESAFGGGQPVRLPPRVYLGWYAPIAGAADPADAAQAAGQPASVVAGERWQFTVRLKAPHGASNPHGFDYELWLWEQGLQASGYVRAGAREGAPRRLGQSGAYPLERVRQRVRDAVYERVTERRVAGLIAALVVGDQNAIDRADWDIFRATGVAHLMSISGLHITMFAWVSALLVGWLWRRSERACLAWPAGNAGLVGGVLLAGLYAVFSGWGVPAQRTCLMLLTVSLLRLAGRRWPWPLVWLLACAVVLLGDPWAMLQSGFWLSFVAVGVLFASSAGAPADRAPGLGGRLAAGMREQWLITLALTPLSLLLFGQVSVVGLAANVLAIPWVTLVVTPLALIGAIIAPVWDLAGWCLLALGGYLRLLAELPFATISIAQPPLWAGVAGIAGGMLLALRLPWWLRLGGVPMLLPVLLWQAPRPEMGHFELLAADIGQGNAIIVRTAGHALVYDAGPRFSRESDAGHRMLVPLLRSLDARLDMVLLSHRDTDHTGGAPALLAMQPQAQLLSSIEDTHELQGLRRARRCLAGQTWDWDGVQFTVLHPSAADYDGASRSNALSCVLRISNGAHTALLTGDIEQPQEARLVQGQAEARAPGAQSPVALPGAAGAGPGAGAGAAADPAQELAAAAAPGPWSLRADLLLVPHHGSKTSSSADFLDAVQPRFALVQAGYRNRFGHPAATVLARYAERGITVFDSPHCGAATWVSSTPGQVRCQRQEAQRYWHHVLPP